MKTILKILASLIVVLGVFILIGFVVWLFVEYTSPVFWQFLAAGLVLAVLTGVAYDALFPPKTNQ